MGIHRDCEFLLGLALSAFLVLSITGHPSASVLDGRPGKTIVWSPAPPPTPPPRSPRSTTSAFLPITTIPRPEGSIVEVEIESLLQSTSFDPLIESATARPPIDGNELRVTSDLIFVEMGRALLNTDVISVNRDFDLTNLYHMLENMTAFRDKHSEICEKMTENVETEGKFVYFGGLRDYDTSAQFCKSNGMTLPELRSFADKIELMQLLHKHDLIETHAGAKYSKAIKTIVFPDNASAMKDISFCGDKPNFPKSLYSHYLYQYYNEDYNTNLVHSYYINSRGAFELCKNVHETLETICMRETKTNNTRINSQIEFCALRTQEISDSLEPLRQTVKLLQETIDPTGQTFQGTAGQDHHSNKRSIHDHSSIPNEISANLAPFSLPRRKNSPKHRVKRANGTIFVSILSIILSLTGFLRSEATASGQATKIGNLEIDTQNVAHELDTLSRDVYHALDRIQEQTFLVDASQSVYQSFLRIIMTLQDSVLAFQATIQSVQYNMVTSQLITGAQLHQINQAVLSQTGHKISFDKSSYHVKPVLVDNRLSVQISIPLLDKSKEVRLYEIQKFPFFSNGMKYQPVCDTKYLAIYEHDSAYNILTADEYNVCRSKIEFCTAKRPKYLSQIPNCASSQFFNRPGHADMVHEKAQDQAPFFLTTNKLTMFAVNGDMDIAFDCDHIDKAGPDLVKKLVNRGNFTTPDACEFSTDLMKFSNPSRHVLDPKASPITPIFEASVPQINNFAEHAQNINIQVRNVSARLRSHDNPTVLPASPHYLLYVSLALAAVSLLAILLLGVKKTAATIRSWFNCVPSAPTTNVYFSTGGSNSSRIAASEGSTVRFREPLYSPPSHSSEQVSFFQSCFSSAAARDARASLQQMEELQEQNRTFLCTDHGDTVHVDLTSEQGPIRKTKNMHAGEFKPQLDASLDSGFHSQPPSLNVDQLNPDRPSKNTLQVPKRQQRENPYSTISPRLKRAASQENPAPAKRNLKLKIDSTFNGVTPPSASIDNPTFSAGFFPDQKKSSEQVPQSQLEKRSSTCFDK